MVKLEPHLLTTSAVRTCWAMLVSAAPLDESPGALLSEAPAGRR